MYAMKGADYYREMFDGSERLFRKCWSTYLSYLRGSIDDPRCDEDVISWLDTIATDLVNDSSSEFYIYG